MNKSQLRECLGRVTSVTKTWAGDPSLGASLRQMSSHVHWLASEAGRRKELCSSSVKNVELRFCQMCRRLKAGSGPCAETLEQCQLLQQTSHPEAPPQLVNPGWLERFSAGAKSERVPGALP